MTKATPPAESPPVGLMLTLQSVPTLGTMDGPTYGQTMLIGELADRTGVSRRSLRYYEQRGLLHADRGVHGWREYSEEAVTRVRNVHALLTTGLSVDDILRVAPCLSQDLESAPACAEAIDMYSERLAAVDERIKVLEEMRSQLLARLDALGAAPGPRHHLDDAAVA